MNIDVCATKITRSRVKTVTLVVSSDWGQILSRLQQLRNLGETTATIDLRSLQVVSVTMELDSNGVLRK